MSNHMRTGGLSQEDSFQTKNPVMRGFSGILGFLFTNAFAGWKYFGKHTKCSEYIVKNLTGLHAQFKITLANQLLHLNVGQGVRLPGVCDANVSVEVPCLSDALLLSHTLVKLPDTANGLAGRRNCFFCYNVLTEVPVVKQTRFGCLECDKPICMPSKESCWFDHIRHGMPKKQCRKKNRRFSK